MAEVATGVLHSVGNVLNSLGVSASLMQTQLRDSRVGNVQRIAALLNEQGDELGQFLADDERGRQMPAYLAQLGEHLNAENQRLQTEAAAIAAHVGHIRNIVAAQQTYARRGGVTEAVDVAELLDNAVAIHFADMTDVIDPARIRAARAADSRPAQADPDPRQPAEQRASCVEGARPTRRASSTLRMRRQDAGSIVDRSAGFRRRHRAGRAAPAVRVRLHHQERRPRLRAAHQRDPGEGTRRRARGVQRRPGQGARFLLRAGDAAVEMKKQA